MSGEEKPPSEREAPHPGGSSHKIVVADDHPLFRSAIRGSFDVQDDLEVIAEEADGQEALKLCRRLRPELVVMDVSMPRMDGLEATRQIKEEFPHTIVLVLSASEEPNHLARALEAGAAGYMLKTSPPKQIIEAVRNALAGEFPLNPELAKRLLLQLMDKEAPKKAVAKEESLLVKSLSPREEAVLRLMAQGYTNQQIARELFLSLSTVKKYAQSIISKLEVSDRTQAAVRAIELGVL